MFSIKQILSLAEVHGPSFYLVDIEKFRENFSNLLGAFKTHYSKTKIAYSYKTNYLPNLCAAVDQLGGYAEVVSKLEMELAQRLNIIDSNIFFNGPIKDPEAVRLLLTHGGTVNIDSLDEFTTIITWLEDAQVGPISLGIRCNFDVTGDSNSRFGLDPRSGTFKQIMDQCHRHPKINLTGFHCHFASRAIGSWTSRASMMVEFLQQVPDEIFSGLKQSVWVVGCQVKCLMKCNNVTPSLFEEYALAAAEPFAQLIKQRGALCEPELIIEPGTARCQ